MDNILVSICCLAHNHGSFISKTIEGFLKQETNFQLEIIIHDDASDDNTAQIILEYYNRFPDLIKPVLQKENQWRQGIRPFVNIVFPMTTGRYVALCEGDDYWTDPLKLQRQVDFLESNPKYALTASDINLVDEYGNHLKPNEMLLNQRALRRPDVDFFDLLNFNLINTLTVCFRRDVISNAVSDAVTPGYWFVIDKWLWLNIAINHKIKIFDDRTAAYRIHPKSIGHIDSYFQAREDNIRYDALRRFFREHKLSELNARQIKLFAKTCLRLFLSKRLLVRDKFVVLSWLIIRIRVFFAFIGYVVKLKK